jgi:hypothetical protein
MDSLLDDVERYHDITTGRIKLSEEEIKNHWHFCSKWGGMLIGPGMDEMKICTCKFEK